MEFRSTCANFAILLPLLLTSCGSAPRTSGVNDASTGTDASGGSAGSSTGDVIICKPGEQRCGNETTLETCAPTGREWIPEPCPTSASCMLCAVDDPSCTSGAKCTGPCESAEELPSSAGCSFIANRMLQLFEDQVDGLIVGNPSSSSSATIQLFRIPEGTNSEVAASDPIMLPPLATHTYELDNDLLGPQYSMFRTGGVWRLRSDLPVIAYLHSPLTNLDENPDMKFVGDAPESSMLLPESALRSEYVVASYPPFSDPDHPFGDGEPSYFTVIAIEDNTTVQWTPPRPTGGSGFPVAPVAAGETGSVKLNRYDTLRVAASLLEDPNVLTHDVSGTVVKADKPIWVVGAVRSAYVPNDTRFADHMQEMMIPIEFWGKRYVGAHSPLRGSEQHHWRIFAGDDNVTVTVAPAQPESPKTLSRRGDFWELTVPNGTDLMIESDGPILPVQYLEGGDAGAGLGDPAMYQMVPVDQFLNRYAFVTAKNFDRHYVQIIRKKGGADVFVDNNMVAGYRAVGDFEVADWLIEEGSHSAISDDPFGVIQLGYAVPVMVNGGPWAAYAYPGGMKVETIFVP